jgi:hypothetical protein
MGERYSARGPEHQNGIVYRGFGTAYTHEGWRAPGVFDQRHSSRGLSGSRFSPTGTLAAMESRRQSEGCCSATRRSDDSPKILSASRRRHYEGCPILRDETMGDPSILPGTGRQACAAAIGCGLVPGPGPNMAGHSGRVFHLGCNGAGCLRRAAAAFFSPHTP